MSVVRSIAPALLLSAFAAGAAAQTPPPAAETGPAQPAQPAQAEFAVEVVTVPETNVLVLPMKGPYDQHPDAFQRLQAFLASRGVEPEGPLFGRYFSDPSVPPEKLEWEVGVPVAAGTTAESPFEVKVIPPGRAAVHVYEGPLDEVGTAWGALFQWIMANGYQPFVPVMMVLKGGDITGGTAQVEMRVPLLE